ncbi:MAG: hypothetical protein CMJ75_13145, partial [Planctomycetaceae bacterium]|nr:hypothetical protein [Planctomycetaceae bacterium]
MELPALATPDMELPALATPDMELPALATPGMELPTPSLTADLPDLSGLAMAGVFANSFASLTGQTLLREMPCPVLFCQAAGGEA